MEPKQETMTADEFSIIINAIHVDILASHLILIEELRSIREEVFDPEKEVSRFFDQRREAKGSLHKAEQQASENLREFLRQRKQPDATN